MTEQERREYLRLQKKYVILEDIVNALCDEIPCEYCPFNKNKLSCKRDCELGYIDESVKLDLLPYIRKKIQEEDGREGYMFVNEFVGWRKTVQIPLDSELVIQEAIKRFGEDKQKVVAMEEMSELIKAISKDIRGQGDRNNLIEEIADVYIMLEQLKEMYGFTNRELRLNINTKVERLRSIVGPEEPK